MTGRITLLITPLKGLMGVLRIIRARRWWSVLSVAVQAAVGTTALGQAPCVSAGSDSTPLPLDRILEPGVTAATSRLPMRP